MEDIFLISEFRHFSHYPLKQKMCTFPWRYFLCSQLKSPKNFYNTLYDCTLLISHLFRHLSNTQIVVSKSGLFPCDVILRINRIYTFTIPLILFYYFWMRNSKHGTLLFVGTIFIRTAIRFHCLEFSTFLVICFTPKKPNPQMFLHATNNLIRMHLILLNISTFHSIRQI